VSVPPRAFSRTQTSHRRSLATRWRRGDSFGWDHPAQAKTHEIRISKHRVASSCGASALSPVRIGAECLRPGESCRRTPANAFAWHGPSDGETRRLRSLPATLGEQTTATKYQIRVHSWGEVLGAILQLRVNSMPRDWLICPSSNQN